MTGSSRRAEDLLSVLPHGLENVGHLLTLPLGPGVLTDPLLQELKTPLVLGDPEQLHGAAFVGRESSDFADQITDHFVPVGQLALSVGGLLFEGVDGGLVTLVHAHANLVTRSHDAEKRKY